MRRRASTPWSAAATTPSVSGVAHRGPGPVPTIIVNDPRTVLLSRLWLETADEVGVMPGFVTMMRHPAEVSASRTMHYAKSAEDGPPQCPRGPAGRGLGEHRPRVRARHPWGPARGGPLHGSAGGLEGPGGAATRRSRPHVHPGPVGGAAPRRRVPRRRAPPQRRRVVRPRAACRSGRAAEAVWQAYVALSAESGDQPGSGTDVEHTFDALSATYAARTPRPSRSRQTTTAESVRPWSPAYAARQAGRAVCVPSCVGCGHRAAEPSVRQRVEIVPDEGHEPVVEQPVEARSRWVASSQTARRTSPPTGPSASRTTAISRPRH